MSPSQAYLAGTVTMGGTFTGNIYGSISPTVSQSFDKPWMGKSGVLLTKVQGRAAMWNSLNCLSWCNATTVLHVITGVIDDHITSSDPLEYLRAKSIALSQLHQP